MDNNIAFSDSRNDLKINIKNDITDIKKSILELEEENKDMRCRISELERKMEDVYTPHGTSRDVYNTSIL